MSTDQICMFKTSIVVPFDIFNPNLYAPEPLQEYQVLVWLDDGQYRTGYVNYIPSGAGRPELFIDHGNLKINVTEALEDENLQDHLGGSYPTWIEIILPPNDTEGHPSKNVNLFQKTLVR